MGHVREGCLCKKRQVKQMCHHFSVATHDNAKSRNRTPGHIGGRRMLSPTTPSLLRGICRHLFPRFFDRECEFLIRPWKPS